MRLVGDDVVDLDDPAVAGSHLRERFVARVCSAAERAQLAAARDPKRLLWSLFAAKEAAFKVVSKLALGAQLPGGGGGPPVFAHRRFEVARSLRSVRYAPLELALRVTARGSWVHAVAWLGDLEPSSAVAALPEGGDPSRVARARLLESLGGAGLEVVRAPRPGSWDGFAPPLVFRRGVPLAVDVSLSHDGRYVAFAHLPCRSASGDAPGNHSPRRSSSRPGGLYEHH